MRNLEQLIDTLLMEVESPRNQAKRNLPAPRITSYLENLGWVQYLQYDMNEFYNNAAFNCEMQIKQKLCQFERFYDDAMLNSSISASTGMYFEYTLFGMEVKHQSDGVPLIQNDHPLTKTPNLHLLKRHDFYNTGEMPHIFRLYDELQVISKERLSVGFPTWGRGPLDLAIQLRGYEQLLVDDIRERPQFVHDLMRYIIEERMRWWDAYCKHFNTQHIGAGIADDWLYVPFISPAIFQDFVFPYYLELKKYHGHIGGVHSCGSKVPFQKLLEELGIGGHEVNHWTDLQAAIRNASPDKYIGIALLNTDVLLATCQEMEAELRQIKTLCEGRNYGVSATAIEKVHDDFEYDIRQVQMWIEIARKVLRG